MLLHGPMEKHVQQNNSTVFALAQITEMIKESIDSRKIGCGISVNLRKAFDTVNHEILLNKLEHYGVRESILKWFQSYLFDHKQFVSFNDESSGLLINNCGVPQGSVLGPLLFLLYINDLPNISKVLNFYLFADDTNIYYESNSLNELEKTINKELCKLYLWLNDNCLSLNIDKTNFIIFQPFNKPSKQNVTIKINKKTLNEKECIKYLGVIIDSSLSWKHHILNLTKKISRSIGMKNVYYSLIYSHIVYAIEVWGSAVKSELKKIFVLQKRVMRFLTFNDVYLTTPGPLIPTEPIFAKLNVLKVDDIYNHQVSKFVFKCIYRITPTVHDWYKFTCGIHEHSTRSNYNVNDGIIINNLFVPSVNTSNYGLKQLKVFGPRIWNKLPTYLKNASTLYIFLKKLKIYYIYIFSYVFL